jgi:hypothetical protein
MHYNRGVVFNNNRADMNKFFNSILEDIDTAPAEGHNGKIGVEWIHFYSRIAIMKKSKEFCNEQSRIV